MGPVATRIADSVARLDLAIVAETLVKHGANVRSAAVELGIPPHDLRRLTLVNQALIEAAYEAEELRLDLAEQRIDEALRSDDSRRHDSAAQFVLRNSIKSKRRGWIPTASSGVDVNINQSGRETVFTWRPMPSELNTEEAQKKEAHRQAEVTRASAEGHKVVQFSWGDPGGKDEDDDDNNGGWRPPVYDDGRRKGDIEGELAGPSVLLEHAAAEPEPEPAEEPAAVEPAAAEPESAVIEAPAPIVESAAVRYQREQVDSWIRARLPSYPADRCYHCRLSFVAGQQWREAANDVERVRFHAACYAEWRVEREVAARQALGLEG